MPLPTYRFQFFWPPLNYTLLNNLCKACVFSLLAFIPVYLSAEPVPPKNILSGYVKDAVNGEELIGATIMVAELKTGTSTNAYGFYSLNLEKGIYSINVSFVGYQTRKLSVDLRQNKTLNIELEPEQKILGEVVVTSTRPDDNILKPVMSTTKMEAKTIQRIPALFGEVDIIKAIQLLPGVQSASEGSSGFSVRGGTPDQNLVIIDEATVYNASHLLGFFSIFNNDAVKDVTLYKGDLPPSTGGRLSSVLDVRMRDGNNKKFALTAGVGNISSRLTLEGPIVKDNSSFIISGRRTYADLFLPFAKDKELRDNKLYFYDFNVKLNHRINDNNRIFLSGYLGRDILKTDFTDIGFGNHTITIRWNHLFSRQLFSNFSIIKSRYDYNFTTPPYDVFSFTWDSRLAEYGLKADFTYFARPDVTLRFGAASALNLFDPGITKGTSIRSIVGNFSLPRQRSLNHALYAGAEQHLSDRLLVKYGARFSLLQNVGPAKVITYNADFLKIDSINYSSGDIYQNYPGIEPRLGINYTLTSTSSVKASYSRTRQFMHQAQNSAAGTPFDIWFSSSPNIKPQVADQFAIGYFRNFRQNTIETSVEAYYKTMKNSIDFKDHASLVLNPELDAELRFGRSWSYGFEFLMRIYQNRLNGWVGYTFSVSRRKFEHINHGKTYPSPYDRPHDVSVVLNYDITPRLVASFNWIYSTGSPLTLPVGKAVVGNMTIPIYSDRNAYRLPAYHRSDVSLILKNRKKPGRRWESEWNVSVYNLYARKNTWAINFFPEEDDPRSYYALKIYLFSAVPAISYNFKF